MKQCARCHCEKNYGGAYCNACHDLIMAEINTRIAIPATGQDDPLPPPGHWLYFCSTRKEYDEKSGKSIHAKVSKSDVLTYRQRLVLGKTTS